jgi:hypothetical protein
MRVDDHAAYFYTRLPNGSSHNFEARNRIMADALNEMVSLYKAEILCPGIAEISDPAAKRHGYYQYLMSTFDRHAEGDMVEYGEHFKEYGDYYRNKLSEADESRRAVVST